MSAKILLLEDDFVLSEIIMEFLEEIGYAVTHCDNARDAVEIAYERYFDLWIFDVKVPLGSGFEVLRELRGAGKNTPAIFITSLDRIDDVKNGYQVGCDDYIKKPFELLELKLRVDTILKRTYAHKGEDYIELDNGLRFGILNQILSNQNGESIALTQKETLLLALLLQYRGNFVSQDMIFESLWGYDSEPSEMSLRAYIKNLRKILGKDAIKNQRGRGYCYAK